MLRNRRKEKNHWSIKEECANTKDGVKVQIGNKIQEKRKELERRNVKRL